MSVYVDRQRYRHDSRTITLGSGGTITISVSAKSFLRLSKEDRDLVGSLLEYLEAKRPRDQQIIVRHEPVLAPTRIVEVLRDLLERWRAQR